MWLTAHGRLAGMTSSRSRQADGRRVYNHSHPLFGFRPDPDYVDRAKEAIAAEWPDGSVTAYLEACLRWAAEEPGWALTTIKAWVRPRAQPERVADALASRIASGELSGRMPAAVEIAAEFGVGKNTPHDALAILVERGLITARGTDGRQGYDVVPQRRRGQRATSGRG
jgi:Bacterial regulatory proteins, gntR family